MIEWRDDLSVGIDTLDQDHQEIIRLINAFIESVETSLGVVTIHDRFRALQKVVHRHFADEETMMRQAEFEEFDAHKMQHDRLGEELDLLWDKMVLDPVFKADDGMKEWLESWLFRHVIRHDFEYRPAMWRLQSPGF
ncbi:bacteriohemerythrin [Magnetospira sp. QH-2]|uniref:bacteriohemerythrin n=1 Tax=Magnetospira sp. (strain QH-2) TaxID=1288970 RepID=UPI0003E81A36|nr:hemerythrin family protein [Magnetospira sp. QH-2]CCQ75037.1 protein of unknown function[Include Hemerythrin HHE cation binding domain] [Magnetospira sp. QH-2]